MQSNKFKLKASCEQLRLLRRFADSCRQLTGWCCSTDIAWLANVPVHLSQQIFKNLEQAHTDFCYPNSKQIKLDLGNSRIFLPKLE